MYVYTTDQIRNVVVLGHGGCGKTSLVEAMAHVSGLTSRIGKVSDGNTLSDYDKEEIKRKFSISTSVVPIVWKDVKINFLDTPGYFDFVGEVEEAVAAADAAIIVVSGKSGVEVGTQKAWDLCEKYNLPRMFFISEMDVDNASFREVVETLTDLYGKKIAPFYQPIRENEKFVGYVNVVKKSGRRFTGIGQREKCEIPDYCMDNLEIYREALMDAVAETSEEFMERYFAGEEFTPSEIIAALKFNVFDGSIIPVSMGSSTELRNIHNLMNDIVDYFPSPDKRKCAGISTKTNSIFEANYDFSKAKTAYVFKSIVDPFIGKYSLVKVCSGVLKPEDVMYNQAMDTEEKLNKLYVIRGNKTEEVKELHAGDIGAIGKLSAKTGDTLCTKNNVVMYARTEMSKPYTYKSYKAKNKGDEDKISQALAKLMDEDLTLKVVNDSANRQTLIYGMGDQHLDVVVSKLLDRYKVDVELGKPKIAFKETIRKNSDVDAKYKKQSGGHGQYGHVNMKFEPSGDLEEAYTFEQIVVGGAVPKNYFPAVEKGLQDSVKKGVLAGCPVVGLKAILLDGSYHPVDSSEMAFKTAAAQAFKAGMEQASPVLLEPVGKLKVCVPDGYTGDIIGDINKRRGQMLGMTPQGDGNTLIDGEVPMAMMHSYSSDLWSITQGKGYYEFEFERYQDAPPNVVEKVIAESNK